MPGARIGVEPSSIRRDRMDMEITFPGGRRVDALYKGFTVNTDQSKEDGGEGAHPAPFDLFLVSLGTCAGIYALSFCRKRGLPTEGLKLIQRAERDEQKKRIARVVLEIRLPAGFPDKYKQAVVKAAELCTVKKYLDNPPAFAVSAVESA
ncbi:MAG: OsmC family protein [Elusimicrobiota bacterium]